MHWQFLQAALWIVLFLEESPAWEEGVWVTSVISFMGFMLQRERGSFSLTIALITSSAAVI